MRNIRKLMLLAVGIMAAMTFLSSAASAQTVRLEQEAVVGNCPTNINIVGHIPQNTQCSIDFESEAGTTFDFYHHTGLSEVLFTRCVNHFEAAFNRDGAGVLYDQILEEIPQCGREPCEEAEGSANPHRNLAWGAQLRELAPPGGERLQVRFCLHPHQLEEGPGTFCTVDLLVNTVGHSYEVSTPPHDPAGHGGAPCIGAGEPPVEWEGHWIGIRDEDHPSFEIHHLN